MKNIKISSFVRWAFAIGLVYHVMWAIMYGSILLGSYLLTQKDFRYSGSILFRWDNLDLQDKKQFFLDLVQELFWNAYRCYSLWGVIFSLALSIFCIFYLKKQKTFTKSVLIPFGILIVWGMILYFLFK